MFNTDKCFTNNISVSKMIDANKTFVNEIYFKITMITLFIQFEYLNANTIEMN